MMFCTVGARVSSSGFPPIRKRSTLDAAPVAERVKVKPPPSDFARGYLSTLFVAAGVDHTDALRSLDALNFGVCWRPESVIDATAQQNAFLLSLCGRQEQWEADALTELESSHAEEKLEQAS